MKRVPHQMLLVGFLQFTIHLLLSLIFLELKMQPLRLRPKSIITVYTYSVNNFHVNLIKMVLLHRLTRYTKKHSLI